jgi:hypothetical protein
MEAPLRAGPVVDLAAPRYTSRSPRYPRARCNHGSGVRNRLAVVVAALGDRGYGLGSTHSEEGAINTSPVGFENLADAQWQ